MPMMIVNDEDFFSEFSKSEQKKDNVIRKPFHGRNNGDNNVPELIREIVADDTSSTSSELSESLGISKSSISAYKHGATSTASYNTPSLDLKQVVDRKLERISRKSKSALIRVLDKMNDDDFEKKLDASKAVELSTIAANMSRVVEKVSPRDAPQNIQNNIIFYAPTPVKHDTFEIIDLGHAQSVSKS